MVHAHTTHVLDEWMRRRGPSRRLPARTELSPILFGPLLPQMFILADDGLAGWRFRVAGAGLETLHGRTLKGESFLDLWASRDRPRVTSALEAARAAAIPQVLACRAETAAGHALVLELVLAPLTGPTGAADRVLGLHQPLSRLAALDGRPLGLLSLAVAKPPPELRLVVDNRPIAPLG